MSVIGLGVERERSTIRGGGRMGVMIGIRPGGPGGGGGCELPPMFVSIGELGLAFDAFFGGEGVSRCVIPRLGSTSIGRVVLAVGPASCGGSNPGGGAIGVLEIAPMLGLGFIGGLELAPMCGGSSEGIGGLEIAPMLFGWNVGGLEITPSPGGGERDLGGGTPDVGFGADGGTVPLIGSKCCLAGGEAGVESTRAIRCWPAPARLAMVGAILMIFLASSSSTPQN